MLDRPETKERVRQAIQPLVRILVRLRLTPNVLTVTGVVLNGLVGLIIAMGLAQLGGVLLIFTSAFDMLDGALAKAQNKVTTFGAFLDSTMDRYSEAFVLAGLLWLAIQRGLTVDVMLIYTVIVGSLLVSYTRARAEGLDLDCRVGLLGRPERIAVLCLGLMLNLVTVALIILAIFTHVTALQRILHVRRASAGR